MSDEPGPELLDAATLDQLPVAAISQSPTGVVRAMNREAERLLGLDATATLGGTLEAAGWEAVRADGAPFAPDQQPAALAISTGETVRDVLMGVGDHDGDRRWLRASSEPRFGPAGAAVGVITVFSDVTPGRSALHELEELTTLSEDLVTRHDTSGRCTWASVATRTLLGLAPRDVIGTVGLPGEEAAGGELLLGAFEDASAAGRDSVSGLTWRARTSTGDLRWVETNGRIRRDVEGAPLGLILFHRDVTERRATEAMAAEAERRFRAGFDHAPIAMKLMGPSGQILRANAAFAQLTGRTQEELQGRSWEEFVHPDDVPTAARAVASLIVGGQDTAVHRRRYLRPDGSTATGIHHLTAIRDDHDHVVQLFGQVVDVTEATRSEARLRASEARLAAVLTAAPDGIVVMDERGTIESFSDSAERIFGWSADAVIGSGVEVLMPEGHAVAHQGHIERYLRGAGVGMVGSRRRLTGQRSDGSTFPLELNLAEVVIDGFRWFTGICRDVTEEEAALARLTESEERFRSLADASPIGIFTTDAEGACTYTNPRWQEIFGLSGPEALGPGWSSTLHPDDATEVFAAWQRTALSGALFATSFRLLVGDEERWVRANARPVVTAGQAVAYVGSVEDVTAERRAAQAVADAEERFRAAFQQAPIGMAEVRPDGVLASMNGALLELFGLDAALPTRLTDHTPADDAHRVTASLDTVLSGREATCSFEHRIVRSDGEERWMLTQVTGLRISGEDHAGAIVQMVDLTERRELEQHLRHQADHDPLTGIANRRAFTAALDHHLEAVRRHGPSGAIALIDLDNFKALNDTLGHAAGDHLLCAVADELRSELRAGDLVARLGGDEFAVLMPSCDRAQAEQLGARVTSSISRRAAELVPVEATTVTASVGIVLLDEEHTDGDALLSRADRSLYDAKRGGRDRFELAARER
ncbi:MAG: PAS domain S-box protein [Actinomycetota bacterium]